MEIFRSQLAVFLVATCAACSDEVNPCELGDFYDDSEVQCLPGCEVDSDCDVPRCLEESECCSTLVSCLGGQCVVQDVRAEECGPAPDVPEGWSEPPGSGLLWVVSRVSVLSREAEADVCSYVQCSSGNQFANVADMLNLERDKWFPKFFLVELAGLDEDYRGFDRSVTLKLYRASDADADSDNNFLGSREDSCCEFVVSPSSLEDNRAVIRIPARIRNEQIEVYDLDEPNVGLAGVDIPGAEAVFHLDGPHLQGLLPRSESEFSQLRLTGSLVARYLYDFGDPCAEGRFDFCEGTGNESATLLDRVFGWLGSPGVDGDNDGAECLGDRDLDGVIDLCCDGAGAGELRCLGCAREIPPVEGAAPNSCGSLTSVADGYSFGIDVDLVPARLRL